MAGTITDEMRRKSIEARNDPSRICGAPAPKSRTGICRNWAGQRTNHKGTGYCWLHDTKLPGTEVVDLVVLSDQEAQDPEILELRREIQMARNKLRLYAEDSEDDSEPAGDLKTMALLLDTIRKLVMTKNKIEQDRRYLIPVSVAVNMAKRLTELISEYLPEEQRFALRDEVIELLRTELALDNKGAWVDPAARWSGQRRG